MKYYGINDLTTPQYYSYVVNYIDNFANEELIDVNDYLKLCNVIKYALEVNLNIQKMDLDNFIRSGKKKLGKYFGKLNIVNLEFQYNNIDYQYREDFWQYCVTYNTLKKVTAEEFKGFISDNDISMFLILKNDKIVDQYKNVIKELLLEKSTYFEYFIRFYNEKENSIYLPNNFSEDEINEWGHRYCDSDNANINFIEIISKWGNHYLVKLNDQLKLKAKKIYNKESAVILEKGNVSQYSIKLKLEEQMDRIYKIKQDETSTNILLNKSFLIDSSKDNEILSIVFNAFNMFSNSGHYLLLPSKLENTLLDFIQNRGKYDYKFNIEDNYKKNVFKSIIIVYYQLLKSQNIDLEKVLFSYFKEYLNENFNGLIFKITNSEIENSYYSKVKSIFPEIDSIFQQYILLKENGQIDFELLEMKTGTVDYSKLKSFRESKFAYIKSNELKTVLNTLFSQNSYLAYINENKVNPFYLRILEGVNIDELDEVQLKIFEETCSDITSVNHKGDIEFVDENISLFLFDLYQYEYVELAYYKTGICERVEDIFGNESLEFDDNLFSRQESNYISYLLDNKKYTNGLSIRNKYIHGNNTALDEDFHFLNYIEALLLLILYIKRINEEILYAYDNNLLNP
ncbi:hypothetical protein [Mammaliicoccus sciuri]|uniref:hypothetical protein n=1 Tax=Mammaliicoccus sciuri TaxID=1296 RepID=UPI003F54F13B